MKKKIIYVGLTFIAFILTDTLVMDNVLYENASTKEITNILTKELNYYNTKTISANGFLLSEGIYGDSHLISIEESNLASITKKEAIKIQELFNKNLNHFKKADFIELTFNGINSENNKIIFKRGKLTNL